MAGRTVAMARARVCDRLQGSFRRLSANARGKGEQQQLTRRSAGTRSIKDLTTDSQSIKDYYETWGPQQYERDLQDWGYAGGEAVIASIKQHGAHPAEAAVLDAGVGSGVQATAMQAAGYINVTGIDIWSGGLAHASKRRFYSELHTVDLQKPFPDVLRPNSFDVIISCGVLTYIDPASPCLPSLLNVCKPAGVLCYTNRTDKMEDWLPREEQLERDKCWQLISRSSPVAYLPRHSEFGSDIKIVISTWRKL
jgi:2-polyprenyl-3-methyl-5-hydroxy-6-metoxy-1,4-benzoquinol methylase